MDNWNNKNAVIRDLERVSRGRIKVNIDTCLTSDKPYSWYTEEETEEEFYKRHCSGDTNFISPDLESINKLLVMVKEGDDIWEDESNNTIKVSKLNWRAKEFFPKVTTKNQVDKPTPSKQEALKIIHGNGASENIKPAKNRQKRNVAMTSILASQLNELKNENLPRKLLKPQDFNLVKSNEENCDKTKPFLGTKIQTSSEMKDDSTIKQKLNELKIEQARKNHGNGSQKDTTSEVQTFENDTSKPKPNIMMHPFSSASAMFRRPTKKLPPNSPENLDTVQKPEEVPKKTGYVPSPNAAEYYKKFVETSELRRAVTEDLWTRTIREMKEMDERKRLKDDLEKSLNESKNTYNISVESLENLFVNLPGCDSDDPETKNGSESGHSGGSPLVLSTASTVDIKGFPTSILLPQHRDLLTGDCAVCKAFKKATRVTEPKEANCDSEASDIISQSSNSLELLPK